MSVGHINFRFQDIPYANWNGLNLDQNCVNFSKMLGTLKTNWKHKIDISYWHTTAKYIITYLKTNVYMYIYRRRSHWGPLWLRHRRALHKRHLKIGLAALGEYLWCCVTLICFCRVVWSLMFVFLEGTLWNCCGERLCQECRVHLDCFSDCSLVDVVMDMLYVRSAPSILRFILTDGSNSRAPPFSSKWVTEEQKLGQYDTKVQSVCNSFRFGEKTEVQCPD